MRRFIGFLLSVVLMLSVYGTVFAESREEIAAKELEKYEIIDTRDYLGKITTEGHVTRAEMAKMLVLMLGLTPDSTQTEFTDVPDGHWASAFIERAVAFGIVNGMGDGTFLPDEYITYQQAIKMIVCALGYSVVAKRNGGYPHGYIVTGVNLGLASDKASVTEIADKGEIMIMLKKALDVPIMVVTEDGSQTAYKILNGKNGERLVTMRTRLE